LAQVNPGLERRSVFLNPPLLSYSYIVSWMSRAMVDITKLRERHGQQGHVSREAGGRRGYGDTRRQSTGCDSNTIAFFWSGGDLPTLQVAFMVKAKG